MNKLIEFFTKQGVFPELITVLVIAGGFLSLTNIRKEAFPNVNFDIVVVATIYPGASPYEVERLISSPLEEDFREVTGIKKMYAISLEGRSEIVIQVDPDQATSDEVKEDIQMVVDRFQDLPDDAEDPIVEVIESKIMPVIEVTVSADKNELDLKRIAKFLEREIEDISQVAKVDILGNKKYEYRIQIDLDRLKRYDVSLQEVLLMLRELNVTIPAGDFIAVDSADGIEKEVVVRSTGEFQDAKSIEEAVLRTNDLGRPLKVKDIASVSFQLADPTMNYRTLEQDTLRLIVKKKEFSDTIHLVDNLKAKLEKLKSHALLEGVSLDFINDSSYYIRNRLSILTGNLFVGLFLVLVILSLFLPFRIALIVSLGIPFSFLAAIWVFHAFGYSLNMISMMGLIIVVGMLVDDAIVVTENSVRLMEEGETPEQAAIKGVQGIWKAVFASVMTTVLAFFPMMMMTGVFGKFVKYIPMAVIFALIASLLEAYFVLPSHFARWVKPFDKKSAPKFRQKFDTLWTKFAASYERVLRRVVHPRGRYYFLGSFFLLLILTGAVAGKLKFVLFPPDGIEIFVIKMDAPKGATLNQTEKLIVPVEKALRTLPPQELMNYIITIGEHRTREDGADTKRGTHYAQAVVYLTPENKRDRFADAIIDDIKKKIGQPENLKVVVTRVNPGPPVGAPLNVGVRGEKFEDIEAALNDIIAEVSKWPGVKDVSSNYSYGKKEKVLNINQSEAALAGLTASSIGTSVRAAYEGIVPTHVRTLDEEIDVRVTLAEKQKSEDVLEKLEIMNSRGGLVPLHRVVDIKDNVGIEAIFHEQARRQFSVSGDLDTNVITSQEVTVKVKKWLKDNLEKKYPDLSFHFGGENEDTDESLASLKRTFLLAFFLIYFILILTFGNFYQPFLIILAIPLGIVSVVWTLLLHGMPLSFMAMLGIIALAGVIVNNAIVFIDFVNEAKASGEDIPTSIVKAGRLRLRAVFLTTATTILGLLPTAYGIGGLDKFVVPVALSLGWGMLIGSVLVMIYVPAFVVVAEDLRGRVLPRIKKIFS